MTIKERTNEFHACCESLSQRSNSSAKLLNQQSHQNAKTEFAKAASLIAREINATMAKLHSLTLLAKKKTLFDDRPNEINELVQGIKQDINKVNRQISLLQQHQRQTALSMQLKEHSSNVITSLQTKLASTSSEFKNILEIRTQNMKDQKNRRDQYSFAPMSGSSTPQPQKPGYPVQNVTPQPSPFANPSPANNNSGPLFGAIPSSNLASAPLFAGDTSSSSSSSLFSTSATSAANYSSPLYNPDRKSHLADNDSMQPDGLRNRGGVTGNGSDSVIDMGGFQQQQLVQGNNNAATMEYIESRGQAIESIESTIAELGQIYSQFTQILSQQREMVQRIDVNVMDTEVNVSNAHGELAKYLERLQGNRWLMIQVFGILVVFFMLFVVIS
ncbi:hypothetical protein CcCBS67573_g07585 [Chytriomyces confervae]|uniref:t-SNARE coiled-coil homology domain-containing protein n=1 Tax=Chytriomyces confervae TaxID=246404 RepID=A0A507ESW4_9FUNG|nr:hypothetical protein CcCBS67573_g07585 [Chytriomyces confervae]